MTELSEAVKALTAKKYRLIPADIAEYKSMKYPAAVPIMRFNTSQFKVDGLGNLFIMETSAMLGLMKLTTIVFTPRARTALPFLLIDGMSMAKKNLCYIEYYDLTGYGCKIDCSESQRAEFANIPDYSEAEAWYISHRAPYSLIKGGKGVKKDVLDDMALKCIRRYLSSAKPCNDAEKHYDNLKAFQRRMIEKGNPSSATLEKLLGKNGATKMFETAIMPVNIE